MKDMYEICKLDNKEWKDATGNFLISSVVDLQAKKILEIGTRSGNSTKLFATATFGIGGHVWTVDIKPPRSQENLTRFPNITILTEDSKKLEWLIEIDILFIDGDHSYLGVKDDIEKYSKFVRPGGRMILHDVCHANHEDIVKALEEWCLANNKTFTTIEGTQGVGYVDFPKG